LFFIAVFSFFVTSGVLAADFPTKPVNLVVAYPAGGSADLPVRAISDKVSEKLGVPVIVVNKPGSGGLLGGQFVATSKPDGYTILELSLSHVLRQIIDPKMPFNVFKDFEHICQFFAQSIFLLTGRDSKFKTIEDMIDYAKKNPGKLSLSSSGIGTTGHFCLEALKMEVKIDFKHVPFAGGEAQGITALMGGHIDGSIVGLVGFMGKQDVVRPLVCFDKTRTPFMRDVPTLVEKGYPEATMNSWFSFAAPAGTPKEIVEKLNNAFRAAIKDPATQAAIKKLSLEEVYKGPTEFQQVLKSEYEKFDKIAKEGGITVK
jgi:tripartite-type tricarboxylate transporter receptor subunit TctC